MSDLDIKGLFLKHASAVQSFLLRRSNNSQLAADLTQESFLRLAEQGEGGRIDNSPAYLYRTARNLLIDHQRPRLPFGTSGCSARHRFAGGWLFCPAG